MYGVEAGGEMGSRCSAFVLCELTECIVIERYQYDNSTT